MVLALLLALVLFKGGEPSCWARGVHGGGGRAGDAAGGGAGALAGCAACQPAAPHPAVPGDECRGLSHLEG
ncbi:hypothetical protein HaLaN_18457 [Haematococcus lacustris]|uniref:Uncharacterized protein n=1 Tax=Haematococcus lacustris TaxID=44745 RepID=A0A699ZF24_HAELA|nr:hypothetical protein HaLaN_18457 [Haematococcus lacustris]